MTKLMEIQAWENGGLWATCIPSDWKDFCASARYRVEQTGVPIEIYRVFGGGAREFYAELMVNPHYKSPDCGGLKSYGNLEEYQVDFPHATEDDYVYYMDDNLL